MFTGIVEEVGQVLAWRTQPCGTFVCPEVWSGSTGEGITLASFTRPADAFLSGDGPAMCYHMAYNAYPTTQFRWHTETGPIKANILFIDGHVAFIEIKDKAEWPGFTWFGR